ncbi:helicase ARIP4 [Cloeon dipterum]|uniref:helicase ARIP4 n=1 Tax=Cloeon dipterum TaxID=197152 RepID=UPI00321FD778
MEPFKSLPEVTIQKIFVPTGPVMETAGDEEDVRQEDLESEGVDSESSEDNKASAAEDGDNEDEDEAEKQGEINGECKSDSEEKVHVPENGPEVDEEIKSDVSPSLCNSIKKRKNSDSEKDTIKKKKRKRKREAKVKKEENTDSESENDQQLKEKRPKNLRKNIREVMTEDVLDEETKAAQRKEMERLIRVQERQLEFQRYMREQNKQMQHLGRLDNCVITPVGGDQKPFVENNQLPSFGSWNSFEEDPMYDTANPTLRKTVLEHLSMPHLADAKKLHPSVQITNAVKHASATVAQEDPESIKPEEVTISSDDDDCMVVAVTDEEEEIDDPTNSGSHTKDQFNIPDDQGRVLINVHEFSKGEPGVFLAPQIARVIKPHQIGGIRFLYDNVIESLERCRANEGFGCILAHSMGLGKTLQVVSFCDIFLRHTDGRRVLCVMPINTLQNWLAEFDMWIPEVAPANAKADFRPRNFKLHLLNDAQKTLVARAKVIRQWKADGGVLLIGYECYRNLCLRKDKTSSKKKRFTQLVDVEENDAKKKLLWNEVHDALLKPGPDLVICDEGHRIKNHLATTSHALKSIQTKRRVVLTGYPLQNNLLEYWCMVDFVRPNYLGTKNEFSNMFERPISNGNCHDSTPDDKRTMRYRAHVLHSLLNGFVQRRSHDVLQKALPPKKEFVLLLRMGDLQKKLCSGYKKVYLKTKAATNPLKAFAVFTKIWNHPDILYHHINNNKMGKDSDLEELIDGTIEGSAGPAQSGKKTRPKKTAKLVTKAKVDVVVKAIAPNQDASHSAQNQDFQFNQNLGYGESSNHYNQQLYQQQQQAYFNSSQQQCYQQPSNQFQAGAEHQEPYNSLAMGQSFQSQQQCWPQQGGYGQSQSSFGGQFDNAYGMLPTTLKPNNEAMMDMSDKKGEEIQSMEKMIDEKIENNSREEESKGSNMPKSGKDDSNSISYDWAFEIMKEYIPGLIEQGPKMQAVFCILEECSKINDRVLLFSQSLYTLNMIEDYLHKNLVPGTNEKWTKNVHYFRLDGNTPAIERERLINEFNANEKVSLFLVSTKAGSLGINLVGANRVIVFDASWNPCHDTQAVCRVYRYGQMKPCYVYRLVMDNCMEKRIYDRQVSKQGMADRVVDELNPDAHLSMKDSSNLLCDSEEEGAIIDLSEDASKYSTDSVLQKLLERYGTLLTKSPFQHESLLIDRKDKKLSKAEKRLAQRHYDQEKQANTKPSFNNYYGGQQGSFSTSGGGIVHATPPTHSIRQEQHAAPTVRPSRVPPTSPPNWRPAEFFEQQGMSVREFHLRKDMTFNTMGSQETALKAGEKVMIMKSPKGVLMQFRNGQITALKSNLKNGNINNNNNVPNAVRNLLPRNSELTITSWPSGQALNHSAHGQVQPDVHDLTSCSSGSNSPGGMAPPAYNNQQMSALDKGINSIPLPHTLMRSNFHPSYNMQHERQQHYRQPPLRSSGGGIVATNAEMQSNLAYQQNYNAYDQQMQQQQQQQPHQQPPQQQQPYGNNSYSAFHRPNFASNNAYASQYNFGGNSNMYQNVITAEMYAPPEYAQESDTYQQQSGFNPMFSSSSQSSGHHYSHQQL